MTTPTPLTLGELQAKVQLQEARIASLIAFASAVVESHPHKDVLLTRWANEIGPSLEQFGTLDNFPIEMASFIPLWVETHKSVGKG